jgi:ElaA protein
VFQDADNKDQQSYHVMGWHNNELAAYTRIVPAGISYKEASIGRVVVSSPKRGKGLARELMQQSINILYDLYSKSPIRIGAQLYLKHFYESIGFQQSSDIYVEDGIEHIEMLLQIEG